MFGLSGGELVTVLGVVGTIPAGFFKLKADLAKQSASHSASLAKAEIGFRDTLIAQEERCQQDNRDLRLELRDTQTRLLIVEKAKMYAEVRLELASIRSAYEATSNDPPPPALAELLTQMEGAASVAFVGRQEHA